MTEPRRIVLFTGDGKGKTTAALGMVLRAAGHGMRALIVQFIKADSGTGEIAALAHLPEVEILQTGRGFLPQAGDARRTEHGLAARDGLEQARAAACSGEYDLIVLDEVCVAVAGDALAEQEVVSLVEQSAPRTTLVLTGRSATDGLRALADTVTEMHCVKHAYRQGVPAQPGVEF